MLAKSVESDGTNWDKRIPYVLFAYRTSLQQSTGESPFFLLYGRDTRLPSAQMLVPVPTRHPFDIGDYKMEMMTLMLDPGS